MSPSHWNTSAFAWCAPLLFGTVWWGGLGRQGKATAKPKLIFQTILGIPFQWPETNGQLRWLLATQQFCTWINKGFCTRNAVGCYLCIMHNEESHIVAEKEMRMWFVNLIFACVREVSVSICVHIHPRMSAYVFTSNCALFLYNIQYYIASG